MKTILKIFRDDIRLLSRRFFASAVIVAISILPALYAWVNIYANGNPYANTGEIKIALASYDTGIDLEDGSHVNMAEEVFEEMKGSDKIGWQFPKTPTDAIAGVKSGKYYAAVIFQDNFTYNMYNFEQALVDDKAPLIYYENQKANAIAPKITQTAANTLQETIKTKYLETVFSYVFDETGELADELSEGDMTADVIKQLENLRDTLRSYDKSISSFTAESKSVKSGIVSTQKRLSATRVKTRKSAAQAQKDLATAKNSLDALKKSIAERKKQLEEQKKALESRVVALYEAGEVQYLEVLLSSKNLVEFLSNSVLIDEITSYDTELLKEVEEKKQIIELAKQYLDENLQQLNVMKKSQERDTKVFENMKIIRQNYIDKLSAEEKEVQAKIDEYKSQYEQVNREILETALADGLLADYVGGVMTWPIPGYTTITSNYGMRTHPITGLYTLHTGVDVSAPIGADFVAANDGIVTKAYLNPAYGNMVMIDHGGGISTLYAHGSEILVRVGQLVKKGEPVLKVGSTGYSTGPHAHFEVRINGIVTNPMEYITGDKLPEYLKEKLMKNEAQNNSNKEEKEEETNKETTSN